MTCFVDSNGSIPLWTEDKKEFLSVTDKIMLDIKAFDEKDHILMVGVSNENVIKNFKFLVEIGKIYEVRTVIVPEIIDNEKTVDNISKLIAEYDKNLKYKLLRFRQNGVRRDVLVAYTPNDDYMNNLKNIATKNGLTDVVII